MPEDLPAWYNESGYVILVIALLMVAYEAYRAVRYRPERYPGAFMAIGLMYLVGLGCKVAGLGPEILRSWLSDLGFPMILSALLWDLFRGHQYKRAVKETVSRVRKLELFRIKVIGRRRALYVAVAVSYLYEIVSGSIAKAVNDAQPPGGDKAIVGEFDWYDIGAYTLGGMIGLLIIWRWLKFADTFSERAVQQDVARVAHDQLVAGVQAQVAAADRVTAERQRRKNRRGRGGRGRKK